MYNTIFFYFKISNELIMVKKPLCLSLKSSRNKYKYESDTFTYVWVEQFKPLPKCSSSFTRAPFPVWVYSLLQLPLRNVRISSSPKSSAFRSAREWMFFLSFRFTQEVSSLLHLVKDRFTFLQFPKKLITIKSCADPTMSRILRHYTTNA